MLSHFLRKLEIFLPGRPRTVERSAFEGGIRWCLVPGAEVPDLPRWRERGLVDLVKQNLQRTIERVRLPGGSVYVKQCRVNTPRSWLRDVVRPAKARLEFENAIALRKLGIDAVSPVAWGKSPGWLPSTSLLVTREEAGTMPLPELLENVLPTLLPHDSRAIRRQIARGLAAFLAKMHEAGVAHPDPHPGNFLVELPPSRIPRFVLIDVHAVRFGKPLTNAETLANLTLFNRYFQMRASRADRLRFWRVYAMHRENCGLDPRALEEATERSNHRFWSHRLGRYLGNNREFRRIPGGNAVRELDDAWLQGWLADPDAPFRAPSSRLLKDSRSSTVAIVQVAGRPIVLKRFRLKNRMLAIKNLFRPSPALRSWILGHNLRDRGLPTPRPLAMFHRYRLGVPCEGYIAFEFVADGVGLAEAVAKSRDFREVRAWIDPLGRLLRDLHDRQVSHRDLKAANVMLEGGNPILVDLVGVRIGRDLPAETRVRELARLNASFLAAPQITKSDRLRLLRAYQRWALFGRPDWKTWWRAIAIATAEKIDCNSRTGRVLA